MATENIQKLAAQGSSGKRGLHPYSEDALALRFATLHQTKLRFVTTWGIWLVWVGTHWLRDATRLVVDLVRELCREAARKSRKRQLTLESAHTVSAVEKLAKSDRKVAATTGQWDADPWLLGTPGGTVDLRSGVLRPSDPNDYITKTTAVAPSGECPLWRQFIREVTAGDEKKADYLQRVAGYWLTGSVAEDALFFLFGDGANGKTTFCRTLACILHDYTAIVPMRTLMQSKYEEHPTEIAKLHGARLALGAEAKEGEQWDVAKIKLLTGRDPLTGRFMRQDYFDFLPTHKLAVISNTRPRLGIVDHAIRRRLQLMHFKVKFTNPDNELDQKLKSEWPAILAWMVEGCLEWQRIGLAPPPSVIESTAAYLHDQDDLTLWIEECCEIGDPEYAESVGGLYSSYTNWAEENQAQRPSITDFSQVLGRRGFEPHKSNGKRMRKGIRLRRDETRTHAGDF